MGNLTNFNNNGIDPAESNFDPLPEGQYNVWVDSSEIKQTKAGNGSYLNLQLKVLEGQYENRTIFTMINLENPNPQAVAIGKAQLMALCKAIGEAVPDDSADLHNKPFTVKVGLRKRKDSDEMDNVVKKFMPRTVEPVSTGTEKPW